MQFTITISQTKALDWGLNAQQALLFAFVYECPSWANPIKTDDGIFFALSKAKIIEELPLLTDKPDTAYRLLKQLADAGVIDLSSTNAITLVRLTAKGKEWNRREDGSEKYPSGLGKISDQGRKNIRSGSEKSPTNQDTNNQDTNNPKNLSDETSSVEAAFELFWKSTSKQGSKKKAGAIFASACKRDKLAPMEFAATLTSDVTARTNAKQFGFDRLHITTYLTQERWKDETPKPAGDAQRKGFAQDFSQTTYEGTPDDQFADIFQ